MICSDDLRKKLQKGSKDQKKKPAAIEAEDDSDEEEDDDEDDDEDELNETAEQESGEDEEEDDDDEDDDDEEDEDDSDDEAPAPPAKQQKLDPKAQQNGKQQKQKNGLENGDAKKQKQPETGKIQKLQGGLQVQDLKVGSGAEAKPGKKVQVYYEGRLKSNNKVFDSTKSGAGFKLTLGRGEVIKGWDLGLNGMKAGGKRRLVIPPGLAYGQKGSPPVIPQNATLVFDVELKNVF